MCFCVRVCVSACVCVFVHVCVFVYLLLLCARLCPGDDGVGRSSAAL